MIDHALDFLCKQVNNYLIMKLDLPPGEVISLFNISFLGAEGNGGGGNSAESANTFLTLVNIEEDRVSKSQENFIRRDNTIVYKNPKVFLNLYILFSVNLSEYKEALKRLSFILQFFQFRNVFDNNSNPDLNPAIEKLIVDMYSLNFEQANQLWGTLGGKYLPSVLYKLRLVGIEEDAIDMEAGFIKIIETNAVHKKLE